MRKPVIVIFLLFTAICALTGCSVPIGTIYGHGNEANYLSEPMWLVPRRVIYLIDDKFERYKDFQIFIVEDNAVKEIALDTQGLTIEMTGNLNSLNNGFTDTVIYEFYSFRTVGRHNVTVKFQERSAYYSIEVNSPNNGSGGLGGDGGIGIIWLD